jgi:TP901 family phage tail tape measure protein
VANSIEYIYSVLDRFSGPLNHFQEKVKTANQSVERISKSAQKMGADLSMRVTAPIIAMGTASVYAFGKFDSEVRNVMTLLDESQESMASISSGILDVSKRVPVAISDISGALYDVRSAGISAADQFEVLEQSARLGVAGIGSTKEAVDLVTSSINAFGLEGEAASGVYDQIFTAIKGGKTTITGLAQGFGAVAGTVAATGTQLDEYLASVSALTTTGLPAAQAHTQLRAVMSGLTRDSKETSAVFRRLGAKDFKGLIDKSGGLVPALRQISDVVGGNEAHLLKMVGSTEALNAILGLTGEQGKAFETILNDMRDGAASVDDAFEKQSGGFKNSMQTIWNSIQRVAIQVGEVLAPYIMKAGEFIGKLADKFDELSPSAKETSVIMLAIGAAIGPLLVVMGTLGIAVAAVGGPVVALVAAGSALAAAMVYLTKTNHPVVETFGKLWDAIKRIFAPFGRLLGLFGDGAETGDTFSWVMDKLGDSIQVVLTPLVLLADTLATVFELIEALASADLDFMDALDNGLARGKDTIMSGVEGVQSFFGFGDSDTSAQDSADQRAATADANVNLGGEVVVRAGKGSEIESANITVNTGGNVASLIQ